MFYFSFKLVFELYFYKLYLLGTKLTQYYDNIDMLLYQKGFYK